MTGETGATCRRRAHVDEVPQADHSAQVRAAFAALLADRDRIVPVVAGLSIAAGVPGLAGLHTHLLDVAGRSSDLDP